MTQKKSESKKPPSDGQDLSMISDESSALGEIRINHAVVAQIVRVAAAEVSGFIAVAGGGFVDEIAGIFSRKEAGAGVQVEEDGNGNYQITVRVILTFGIELAKTAAAIQEAVREKVAQMTNKKVAKVDVVIDGIQMPGEGKEKAKAADWEEPEGER